jgi:magnesium chelatase subunit D
MVGQQNLQLGLLLNVIDPAIGGVLICGQRGTGKSTAVRALAALFPILTGVADCPYFCDPDLPHWMCGDCLRGYERGETRSVAQRPPRLVTLPLNASVERVAGSFDLGSALAGGERLFEPGLLAAANRGVLYIDEINLLNDHIADLLLDASGLGIHRVERDGISSVHPARLTLVGTMNPAEGPLRAQLLDRIGLCVEVEELREVALRATVVERRLSYDAAPLDFVAQWAEEEEALRARIQHARQLLPAVSISAYLRQVVAYLVDHELHAQGHRGEMAAIRTARALAAWESRLQVERAESERALALALPHRARPGSPVRQRLAQTLDQFPAGAFDAQQPEELGIVDEDIDERSDEREGAAGLTRPLHGDEDVAQIQDLVAIARDRLVRTESGRRFTSLTARRSGRSPRARQASPPTDIAFAATIRAAAPFQRQRGRAAGDRLQLRADDLRQKVRERKTRALLIFVIDGSDSVMARQFMLRMKRVLLALLHNAYTKRDRVALLVFRFAQCRLELPPTRNFSSARRCVEKLYIGGCTPLATGLLEGLRLAESERLRDDSVKPLLIILTDGLANIDLSGNMRSDTPWRDALHVAREIALRRLPAVMIDTHPVVPSAIARNYGAPMHGEEEPAQPGRDLAHALAADYYQLCSPHDVALLRKG